MKTRCRRLDGKYRGFRLFQPFFFACWNLLSKEAEIHHFFICFIK